MDELISRAENLLCFLSEEEAAKVLLDAGEAGEDVFLAIKAARTMSSKP
jgi:hypothetical protein